MSEAARKQDKWEDGSALLVYFMDFVGHYYVHLSDEEREECIIRVEQIRPIVPSSWFVRPLCH